MESVVVAWIGAAGGILAGLITALRVIMDSRAGVKSNWFTRQERYYERLEDRAAQMEARLEARNEEIITLAAQVFDLRTQLRDLKHYVRVLRSVLTQHGIPLPEEDTSP